MKKLVAFMRRYPKESLITIVLFPLLYWAVYEDSHRTLPWWFFPLGLAAWLWGLGFMMMVVDPILKYLDAKMAKLLRLKIK
jgi:hypothetical protein